MYKYEEIQQKKLLALYIFHRTEEERSKKKRRRKKKVCITWLDEIRNQAGIKLSVCWSDYRMEKDEDERVTRQAHRCDKKGVGKRDTLINK